MTVDQVREAILNGDFVARLADPGNFSRGATDRVAREQSDLEGGTQRAPASAELHLRAAEDSAADAGRPYGLQAGTTPSAGDKAFNASSGNVIFVPIVYDPPPARDPTEGFCGGWVERRVLIENYSLLADSDSEADNIALPGAVSFAAAVTSGSLSEAKFDDDLSAALGGLGAGQAVLFAPDAGDYAGGIFLVVDGNGVAGYQEGEDYVFGIAGSSLADLTGPTDFFI